jgi:hypothetical protein
VADDRIHVLYGTAVRAAGIGAAREALQELADYITAGVKIDCGGDAVSGDLFNLDSTPPASAPPRLPHNAAVIPQYRTVEGSGGGGWSTYERTGLVCLVCNCGVITGWLPHDEVMAVARDHMIQMD